MGLRAGWIKYGDEAGYLARPAHAAGPLPAVIVIQEIGGVNDNIEDITRRIAAAGYVALAPDLFAAGGERPAALAKERVGKVFAFMATLPPGAFWDKAARDAALAKLPPEEGAALDATIKGIGACMQDPGGNTARLRKAFAYLSRDLPEARGRKVGCVGFCMGGGLSALLACEEEGLGAAAVFYGTSPAPEQAARIRCPVIGFYGSTDQRINATVPALEDALARARLPFEKHVYEGAKHAFFNDDARGVYDADAARDAFARLLAFFNAHLAGG